MSPIILITLKIILPQHSVFFHNILFHLSLRVGNSVTLDSEVLPTIALHVSSSGIPCGISVFVRFIFFKVAGFYLDVPTPPVVFIMTPLLERLPYLAQKDPSTLIERQLLSRARFQSWYLLSPRRLYIYIYVCMYIIYIVIFLIILLYIITTRCDGVKIK